jgi:hypothetical protein
VRGRGERERERDCAVLCCVGNKVRKRDILGQYEREGRMRERERQREIGE